MLYSHPGKPLIEHLENVAQKCVKYFQLNEKVFGNLDFRNTVKDLAFICGAFHDIGKSTTFFQHYLLHPDHEQIGPKNHALISALFVKEFSKTYLERTKLSQLEKDVLAHFAFTAVKRHHGRLRNFKSELDIKNKASELEEQVLHFQEIETIKIINHFNQSLHLNYSWANFKEYILSGNYNHDMIDFYLDVIEESYQEISAEKKICFFYTHQLIYSCLLFADKADVILEDTAIDKGTLGNNLISNFRKKNDFDNPGNELDQKKNQAFHEAVGNLKNVFSPKQHIYSLTLPTGLGKTITSFACALEIKKLLSDSGNNISNTKIIIAIPFTSIIDQNFEVYEKIVNSRDSNLLLKHHHLSEPSYKVNENIFNADRSQFLIETWQSKVVVTTFVQLIDSLFSNDKSKLLKLPGIANSVIILDEVQSVPYQLWPLIKQTFQFLGENFNCYFIFMSATQPLIFNPEASISGHKEIQEIIPDHPSYFRFFDRTRLINKSSSEITIDDYVDEVADYLIANPNKDVLVILNTRKHCLYCFEQLVERIDAEQTEIVYLSTLITPFERKQIIKRIKEKKSGKQQLIVSTQLIEAGVDLSVDTVFRTLAPLDSIIQAAGRANRYGEKGTLGGTVILHQISETAVATSRIYGADLIQKTRNVLSSVTEVNESGYLELIESYYREVKTQADSYRPEELNHLVNLKFEDLGNFSLISEGKTESVFVQLDERAASIWREFEQLCQNESLGFLERRKAFAEIKNSFYDYVVNVPIPFGEEAIAFDTEKRFGFYVSDLKSPSKFYQYSKDSVSRNIGYKEMTAYSL